LFPSLHLIKSGGNFIMRVERIPHEKATRSKNRAARYSYWLLAVGNWRLALLVATLESGFDTRT
jgi:hypothetical protein